MLVRQRSTGSTGDAPRVDSLTPSTATMPQQRSRRTSLAQGGQRRLLSRRVARRDSRRGPRNRRRSSCARPSISHITIREPIDIERHGEFS